MIATKCIRAIALLVLTAQIFPMARSQVNRGGLGVTLQEFQKSYAAHSQFDGENKVRIFDCSQRQISTRPGVKAFSCSIASGGFVEGLLSEGGQILDITFASPAVTTNALSLFQRTAKYAVKTISGAPNGVVLATDLLTSAQGSSTKSATSSKDGFQFSVHVIQGRDAKAGEIWGFSIERAP